MVCLSDCAWALIGRGDTTDLLTNIAYYNTNEGCVMIGE